MASLMLGIHPNPDSSLSEESIDIHLWELAPVLFYVNFYYFSRIYAANIATGDC